MSESPHDTHRLAGYLTAMSVFGAGIATSAIAARARDRSLPDRYAVLDLVLGALATHKFARVLSKDGVTTPLRAPFTEFERNIGSAEVEESPKKGTISHVPGELLTCPFCLAPWIATAYVAGLTHAPRQARAWAAVFSIVGASDFLQHAYGHIRTD